MPKIKVKGNYISAIGIRSALHQICAAGPHGLDLVRTIEASHLDTVFHAVDADPTYRDRRGAEWSIPVDDAGGGVTLIPKHPYAKGKIRVLINLSSTKSYQAVDGTVVPVTRTLLVAHELGHCRLVVEGHASHQHVDGTAEAQRLAIEAANPVYVELGAKERDPASLRRPAAVR